MQSEHSLVGTEVPVSYQKLKYIGFIHPSKLGLFNVGYDYFVQNDKSIKGDNANIYQYENLYVATKGNSLMDRYLVYYTIRCYLIIKYRMPQVYSTLFYKTASIPTNFLRNNSNAKYANVSKNLLITFDGVNVLPESYTYFGPTYRNDSGLEIYPNTEVFYFNKNTILNGGAVGNVSIYKSLNDPADKFHTYMRDGFVQTFVHEKIHGWFFQHKHLVDQIDFVKNVCPKLSLTYDCKSLEEMITNNTTNILFDRNTNNSGLSDAILNFYSTEFDLSISNMKKSGSYDLLFDKMNNYYSESDNYTLSGLYNSAMDHKVFFLDLFKDANQPN